MSGSEKPKSSWRECRKTITHWWHVPFAYVEWTCWRVTPFLEQLAFLKVLEYLGRLAVLIAVVFYFTESGSRQKAKHYQAWQVINLAQGKSGSGGRMDALQDLYGDGISLAGVDLSKAHLLELKLESADLREANLSGAVLPDANLSRANLLSANFSGAVLRDADLIEASLIKANLSGVVLRAANLSGANLYDANLANADLVGADLSGAILLEAKLVEANLANIKNWRDIKSIENANIYEVKNPPDGFIDWAKDHGAVEIEDEKERKNKK